MWFRLLPACIALPTLLLLLQAVGTTDRYPSADGPHMLAQALRLATMVREGALLTVMGELFQLSAPHPPFGYLPLILGALLTGTTRGAIVVADAVWLLLLLDGTIRLCRPAPAWAGAAAWALASASAMTWWSADHHGFDLVVAATLVQALSWLSTGLERPAHAAAFGFWLGAGFLSKYSFPLIAVLPVVAGGLPLLRQPRRLGPAVAVWAVVALPWLVANHSAVVDYVGSALNPPVAPGNFPAQRTLLDRFAGEGQLMFLAVLKDALGWPGFAVLVGGAVVARRGLPLWGLASGLLFLGAMNSREGRYALPLVFLLAAAGAPTRAATWRHGVMLLVAGLPLLRGTAAAYAMAGADAPARRPLEHDPETFSRIAPWPAPATPFLPVSEHPGTWKLPEVIAAIDAPVFGVLVDGAYEAPQASVYQLVVEEQGARKDIVAIHGMIDADGLQTQAYRGPLTGEAEPLSPGARRREPPSLKVVYVVTGPQSVVGARWLAETPHTVLQTWALPMGHTGRLVELP